MEERRGGGRGGRRDVADNSDSYIQTDRWMVYKCSMAYVRGPLLPCIGGTHSHRERNHQEEK